MPLASSGTPLVVAHRGASGYRPEHTLEAYEVAARMGADLVEPDLVPTRDGVLVACHENDITGTTDVAGHPELADRRTTKVVDGVEVTGWFTEDLTLAELKTLRAAERLPQVRPGNTAYDGMFEVPTFAEILALRERLSAELGREVGVYPETKHPTYFAELGLALEEPLVAALEGHGLNRPDAPVFVQSFEMASLVELRSRLGLRVPTVLLLGGSGSSDDPVVTGDGLRRGAHHTTAGGLGEVARAGIDGIGPDLEMVVARGPDGSTGRDTGLVGRAHAAGLVVHPWTFRAENVFLRPGFRLGEDPGAHGDLAGQITAFLEVGIDGFFTDHPDVGVAALDAWTATG